MSNIHHYIQKRSFSIITAFAAITVFGLALIWFINIEWHPSSNKPEITIHYIWPGAAPEMIEKKVTAPLERLISTLEHIKNITSTSRTSSGEVSVIFNADIIYEKAKFAVMTKIRQLRKKLPKEMSALYIQTSGTQKKNNAPLFTIALRDRNINIKKLNHKANNIIRNTFSTIKGVNETTVNTLHAPKWLISINESLMITHGLTLDKIARTLKKRYAFEKVGLTKVGTDKTADIYIKQSFENIHQLKNLTLINQQNKAVRLDNIAQIKKQFWPHYRLQKVDGDYAVLINIFTESDANVLQVAKKVKNRINQLNNALPNTATLEIIQDQSILLKKKLIEYAWRTLLTLSLLIVFIWIVYRQFSYILILLISIIVNLSMTMIAYYFLKVSLNLYSLAAITISLGFIIDNSIIVIDHYKRKRNLNIILPVIAAVLTTLAALLSIIFMNEQSILILKDFAYVLIINLTTSVFISLFFIPSMMVRGPFQNHNAHISSISRLRRIIKFYHTYLKWGRFVYKRAWLFIIVLLLVFGTPIYKLPHQLNPDKPMSKFYNSTFGNSWVTQHIRPIIDKTLGGTLRLFDQYVFRGNYKSVSDDNKLKVAFSLPEGTPYQQASNLINMAEDIIEPFSPYIHYSSKLNGTKGLINIEFDTFGQYVYKALQLRRALVKMATNKSGVKWNISGIAKTYTNEHLTNIPGFSIVLYGYNYRKLLNNSDNLIKLLCKNPRISNIRKVAYRDFQNYQKNKIKYEAAFLFNPFNLYSANQSPQKASQFIREHNLKAFAMLELDHNNYKRKYLLKLNQKGDVWWLHQSQTPNRTCSNYSSGNYLSIEKTNSSRHIIKEDQEYRIFVEFDYVGSEKYAKQHIDSTVSAFNNNANQGYYAKFKEENILLVDKSKKEKPWAMILSVSLLVFFITAVLFNNLRQSLIIMLFIPISFTGVLLIYYLNNIQFDQGGYAAFILTGGLSVNALCFIFNDYNLTRKKYKKKNHYELFNKAVLHKISPISLTIISTVIAFIPFIVGPPTAFWYNLAVGTIGGLLYSLLVILLFVNIFRTR